jgi:hypothetical protein
MHPPPKQRNFRPGNLLLSLSQPFQEPMSRGKLSAAPGVLKHLLNSS